ncbi:glycosyltransferase [Stieleria sp. TO1_6]|uniref:glycosyltransferase n=1 Tax=Stieleria tagensis TaxID=2956795 RepID=UPI00209B1DD2|nr:glycosyltransferase [Stieleria tagensis]MCO8122503.1 glycosyltransferase [Stieleria tagensis]
MKILFLQKRLLFPPNTGGKIRTLNVVRHLAEWHDLTYVCNLLPEEQRFLPEMRSLGVELKTVGWTEASRRSFQFLWFALRNLLFSPLPLNVQKDQDSRLRSLVQDEVESGQYDLLICDFVQTAGNCIGLKIPKLLFQHNVEAEIFERLADRGGPLWRLYLSMQAGRMRQFEGAAGKDFNGVVAVSERDKMRFETEYSWRHVRLIDTAVDTNYFQPPPDASPRAGVVFVGSMDWPPNVDGVLSFISGSWQRIRADRPDVSLTIVGRNPPASLLHHQGRDGIRITGTVDDIRPYLSASAVAVVPLHSGGGTRLKIFESMAMGCPVVSTELGAEGLPLQDGEHLLIRDGDQPFADAVLNVLADPDCARRLARSALALVQTKYSSMAVARQFEQHCREAIADSTLNQPGNRVESGSLDPTATEM